METRPSFTRYLIQFIPPLSPVNLRRYWVALWLAVSLGIHGLLLPSGTGAATGAGAPTAAEPPKLLRITPSGDDVPVGRQLVFEFDRSVVPLGRMERESSEIPIAIEPALECQWRWLNPSTLACQLPEKKPLLPATRYRVTVRPEITAESGAFLPEAVTHSFLTQRPAVKNTSFRRWLSPGEPQFTLWFNQPVEKSSVAAHVFFLGDGQRRTPVTVSEEPSAQDSPPAPKGAAWLVQPSEPLPPDRAVALHIEPGILPLLGKEPGVQQQSLSQFHTFSGFHLSGVECQDVNGTSFAIPAGSKPPGARRCDPTQPVSLLFSSPPLGEGLHQAIKVSPDLTEGKADEDPWESVYVYSGLSQLHQEHHTYSIMLPMERIRAYTEYRVEVKGGLLRDAFGRPLDADGVVRFATAHYPPDLTLFRDMPVLEKNLDTDLPVVTMNLDRLKVRYRTILPGKKSPPRNKTIDLPKSRDKPFAFHLGLRKMLDKPSGIIQGKVTAEPAPRSEQEGGTSFFAQITPFQVHVKLGHHNTLVWVTDLASGAPVPGARLEMHEDAFSSFHERPRVLAQGETGAEGIATLPGTAAMDPELNLFGAHDSDQRQLFLWCRKGDDVAVLPLSYAFQVSSEGSNREYIPEWIRPRHGHLRSWGTTAQGIYRAGDTVQYKIYVRDQDNRRFVAPPGAAGRVPANQATGLPPAGGENAAIPAAVASSGRTAPEAAMAGQPSPEAGGDGSEQVPTYHLKVMDPLDKVVHELNDIRLSAFGAFDGAFPLPRTAAVGWYRFVLTSTLPSGEELEPMRVLVSDFTPSPFKVSTELNGTLFSTGDPVTVATQATLHAGGPYARASARITARIETQRFEPGTAVTRGFEFDVVEHSVDGTTIPETQSIFEKETPLDDRGFLETTFQIPENPIIYGKLTVESGVRDDRGKRVAHRASVPYAGRQHYVGLAQDDWVLEEKKPAAARVVVVDRLGEPVSGIPIRVAVERQVTRVAHVKGAGKAYIPQYTTQWIAEEDLELTSELEPLTFIFTPRSAGVYRIRARIGNVPEPPSEGEGTVLEPGAAGAPEGRSEQEKAGAVPEESGGQAGRREGHQTILRRYVLGKGYVVWESIPGNVLNVVPDKTAYRTGETARFLVQNPFPGCRALVTVERFGIMQSWVTTLESSSEIVEVPIAADHLPGFYFSVVVVSPRVDKPMGDAGDDLGKPTFRMGYARVEVKDDAKQIAVDITPDREVYKPRETVTVDLQAKARVSNDDGGRAPVELAVAVLDEAVFALLPGRKVFDPYEGFYTLDPLDLSNYNLLMQLVGRQKLEKKGANPGGGGGPDLGMRSDFRFVAYWNPSILVDDDGKARIEFTLPDSLTGWRILALAVTPEDRMGLGEKVFRVNQPTEIRPALPNQVLDGDRFEARFTVMNRTDQERTVDVELEAQGAVAEDSAPLPAPTQGPSPQAGPPLSREPASAVSPGSRPGPEGSVIASRRQLTLAPFTRQAVGLPLQAKGHGSIRFMVRAGDSTDRDALTVTLPVLRRQSPNVAAVHGMTREPEVAEKVLFPGDMAPETGLLRISASSTVLGGLEGVFEYMRDYPHVCWEQLLSKGLMAAFYKELRPYIDPSLVWSESDELPAKTAARAAEFQAPSGGMCYFLPRFETIDPYLSAFTALGLGWLRERGHPASPAVEENLEKYLRSLLQRDPTPGLYSRSMNATVRAVALLALAERGRLPRDELERFESHVPEMSLFGKAMYLQALTRVSGTEPARRELLRQILAQADHSAAGIVFRETLDLRDGNLLLSSTLRDQGAVLSALVAYESSQGEGRSELGAIPLRLARTIVQGRKVRRHWRSTQENLFAVKALLDFSRTYERDRGPMTVQTWLDATALGSGELRSPKEPPLVFEYRAQGEDPGREAAVRLAKTGEGPLVYSVTLSYDTPVPAPGHSPEAPPGARPAMEGEQTAKSAAVDATGVLAGIEVHREYCVERDGKWVLLQGPGEVSLGDLVRVDLFVSIPAERYFVVLDDPVPGGLEPVNRDLATASLSDVEKGNLPLPEGSYGTQFEAMQGFSSSRWAFYHRELRHEAARFYSEILPAGRYHLTYVAQAVAPGTFTALPPRAEEMYNPEVFGKGRRTSIRVVPVP